MESYLPFCRRMRRATSYLPCSSQSLSWSLISCSLLRTRTTSRRDWRRSSRNSRTLFCPCRIWFRTTTLMPSHSECKHHYPYWTDTETKIYQWLIWFKFETWCMHSCINEMSNYWKPNFNLGMRKISCNFSRISSPCVILFFTCFHLWFVCNYCQITNQFFLPAIKTWNNLLRLSFVLQYSIVGGFHNRHVEQFS